MRICRVGEERVCGWRELGHVGNQGVWLMEFAQYFWPGRRMIRNFLYGLSLKWISSENQVFL